MTSRNRLRIVQKGSKVSEKEQNEAISRDLDDIDRRLVDLRQKAKLPSAEQQASMSNAIGRMIWLAFHVVSELLAGALCGFGIGYVLDKWLNTRPIFIAVFLVIGSIAGVLNVVRFLQYYDEQEQKKSQQQEDVE